MDTCPRTLWRRPRSRLCPARNLRRPNFGSREPTAATSYGRSLMLSNVTVTFSHLLLLLNNRRAIARSGPAPSPVFGAFHRSVFLSVSCMWPSAEQHMTGSPLAFLDLDRGPTQAVAQTQKKYPTGLALRLCAPCLAPSNPFLAIHQRSHALRTGPGATEQATRTARLATS